MPYIKPEDRPQFNSALFEVEACHVSDDKLDGAANYLITKILTILFKPKTGWNYRSIAKVVGCLECIKQEFYRRVASPYEDEAMNRNGDV